MKKVISLLFVLVLAACSSSDRPSQFDYGSVDKNQYKNIYFNFTLDIPDNWQVLSRESIDEVSSQGNELLNQGKAKSSLSSKDISNATLLTVYKYNRDSIVTYNPSFTVIAENVSGAAQIKTGSDYLAQVRKVLSNTKVEYTSVDKNFAIEKIGTAEFHTMNTLAKIMGVNINQRYYAAIINDFSLVIIISYSSQEQLQELTDVIKTIKFN